jgi:hypothetical protein
MIGRNFFVWTLPGEFSSSKPWSQSICSTMAFRIASGRAAVFGDGVHQTGRLDDAEAADAPAASISASSQCSGKHRRGTAFAALIRGRLSGSARFG